MQWNRCNVEKYCDYTFLYYINNLIYFSMILLKVSHSEIQILVVCLIFLSMKIIIPESLKLHYHFNYCMSLYRIHYELIIFG